MKKIVVLVFAVIMSLPAKSQYYGQGDVVVSADAGAHFIGTMMKILFSDFNLDYRSTPSLQGSVDYFFTDNFSLGFTAATQYHTLEINDFGVEELDTIVDDLKFGLRRNNCGVRALYNYLNEDRYTLYFGLKLGVSQYNLKTSGIDPILIDQLSLVNMFALSAQLTIFGARVYLYENFGLNMELAIGSPYYFALGAQYRFNI